MCGICGKLNFEQDARLNPALVPAMLDTIRHRGPDDEGVYLKGPVGLGHRRLSIIDLGSGHQPLSNEDGTVWIVFNGEIYNYRELRTYLLDKGHVLKTQSDTEVIVHLYEEFGPGCVEKLRGMFAFGIWDQNTKSLLLARDRIGIKPLYYCLTNKSVVFGSEIKAILADPDVKREVAPEIIDRFLTFLYVPGEETLLKGIHKLPPGNYLFVRNGRPELRQYWDLEFSKPERMPSIKDAESQLLTLLAESVDLHMIADVPVGVLLSGGVDSTAVLGFASEKASAPLNTFTVGFSDPGVIDERPYAKLAAEAFGSRHYEMTISAKEFSDFLPRYVWHMEEPVCEPPAVAMYYVSKLAREHVKVLLSGEGGDEAFAGYSNYRNIVWLERLKRIFPPANKAAAAGISAADSWLDLSGAGKYAPLVASRFPDYYYSRTSNPFRYSGNGLGSLYSNDFGASINRERSTEPVRRLFSKVKDLGVLDQMLYIDTKTWLPDDLLIKADKMTMANSLELRVPLLDHKVLEFAASLPCHYKLNGFTTKYILKEVLSKRVPKAILERKKTGFPVPYESWLRRDFKDLIRSILTDRAARERGYFEKAAVERLLQSNDEHGGHSKEVFSLVTLELWHRTFHDGSQATLN